MSERQSKQVRALACSFTHHPSRQDGLGCNVSDCEEISIQQKNGKSSLRRHVPRQVRAQATILADGRGEFPKCITLDAIPVVNRVAQAQFAHVDDTGSRYARSADRSGLSTFMLPCPGCGSGRRPRGDDARAADLFFERSFCDGPGCNIAFAQHSIELFDGRHPPVAIRVCVLSHNGDAFNGRGSAGPCSASA